MSKCFIYSLISYEEKKVAEHYGNDGNYVTFIIINI